MRYALIREMDISNGEGIGASLFVQGCHFHCPGCFNQETWDFRGGKEWTDEIEQQFIDIIAKPYVRRVSFLGGEPFADENISKVHELIITINTLFPDKKIWIYTGYTFEQIVYKPIGDVGSNDFLRYESLLYADVLVDGTFRLDLQDINHKKIQFAGSTNQRVIDLNRSLNRKILYPKVILYER